MPSARDRTFDHVKVEKVTDIAAGCRHKRFMETAEGLVSGVNVDILEK